MLRRFNLFKAKSVAEFKFELDDQDILLSLILKGNRQPVETWRTVRPDARAAINHLEALLDEEETDSHGAALVSRQGDQLRLVPDCIARLDAATASQLGLPRPTALALNITTEGSIYQNDFHLRVRWVHPGGGPIRASVNGALIQADGEWRRIPEPLWSLYRTAGRLTSPLPEAERFRCIADLQAFWPSDGRAPVEIDSFLKDLRIHYASALSLKLRELQPERTDFDPILFGQGTVQMVREGGTVDEEQESCLAPRAQKLFAEDRFRREARVRAVYVLRDGEYVFIDPSLRPVLQVVRDMQDRPESEKREFVLNPRKILADRLEATGLELPDLEDLFIETEQFSERVAGVDIWQVPVLPWLTPIHKNQWLPERFGLRVGADCYAIEPAQVPTLIDRYKDARKAGKRGFPAGDLLIPVDADTPPAPEQLPLNSQVQKSLDSLEPLGRHLTQDVEISEEEKNDIVVRLKEKVFLVVRENFEAVDYSAVDAQDNTAEDRVEHAPAPVVTPPNLLKTELKPHQREGLSWLVSGLLARRTGALLADDMGLGKTLQAIAFMAWLQEQAAAKREPLEPILVVAPTSLLGNWQNEIHRHLHEPRLGRFLLAFGSALKQLREESGLSARDIEVGRATLASADWKDAGIVLTTYETMRDDHFSFARQRFSLIVFDEMQKLKNPTSQLTRAAKALNAGFILGMTGTPVENRLQDLWSIMDIIAPGLLGSSRDFERRYPANDASRLQELKTRLLEPNGAAPAWLLRRMKSDVLDALPRKHVHVFEDPMPDSQAREYENLVFRAVAQRESGAVRKGGMLELLGAMRSVSLYPHDVPGSRDLTSFAQHSARIKRTLELLETIRAKNEKALLFIESLELQAKMAELLKEHFSLPHTPMRINGSVPPARRQEVVDRFQGRPGIFDVMILSPKAGGVGLTLTAANHVIHLSRWWNPAVEDQATDRIYRIGQTRDVHVYLPLAVHPSPQIRQNSFDLRLHALLERKRKLTHDLLAPAEPADNDITVLFDEIALHAASSPAAKDAPPQEEKEGTIAPNERAARLSAESGEDHPLALTQDVSAHSSESGSDGSASPQPDTAQAAAPDALPSPPRKILTLARELNRPQPQRFEWKPGHARQPDILFDLFKGKLIAKLTISDPYALADEYQRDAHVRFLEDLTAVAERVENVVIEYAPDISYDANDMEMRRDFGRRMAQAFVGRQVPIVLDRRYKRSKNDDFHDRTIQLHIRSLTGAVHRHLLDGGRGILALYDESKICTFNYWPPADETLRCA